MEWKLLWSTSIIGGLSKTFDFYFFHDKQDEKYGSFKEWVVYLTLIETQFNLLGLLSIHTPRPLDMADEITSASLRPWSRDLGVGGGGQPPEWDRFGEQQGWPLGHLTQRDCVDFLSAGALLPQGSVNRHGSVLRRGRMFEGPNSIGSALSMHLIATPIVLPLQVNKPDRESVVRQVSGAGGGAEHANLFLGSSDKLWGLYLTLAQEEDQEQSVNWIGDSQGILVFVRVHVPQCNLTL